MIVSAAALCAVFGTTFAFAWRTVDALPVPVRTFVAGALALLVASTFAASFALFQAFV